MSLDIRKQLHLSIQITDIAKRQLQFLARLPGLQRVKQHRCLADGMKRTVDPARTVLTRQLVNSQGNLCQREPAGITLLPNITLQLRSVDIVVFPISHHLHAVQHNLTFRDVTRSRTCSEKHEQENDGQQAYLVS